MGPPDKPGDIPKRKARFARGLAQDGKMGPPDKPGDIPKRKARFARVTFGDGWGGRDRTSACRNQNPVPYRLATPQQALRAAGTV